MLDKKLLKYVKKATQGDNKAFAKVCETKAKDVFYLAVHMIGNTADAEDAMQEILIYMHKHIRELKEPKAFQVWMYRITRSICMDMMRKKGKEINTFEEKDVDRLEERKEFLPYEYIEDSKKREELLRVINELPERCKMCVLLFYYENMSYKEIAKALCISKKDVDNTLIKAKKLIRHKLEQESAEKIIYSRSSFVAAVPVLAQVLRYESDTFLTSSAVSHIQEICDAIAVGGTAALGTGLGSSIISGSQSGSGALSGLSGMSTKITLGIVTTVSAATIGVVAYNNEQKKDTVYEVQHEETDDPEPISEIATEPIVHIEEVEPVPIDTLEDMIGNEEAEQLREMVSVSNNKVVVNELLETLGMVREEGIVQSDPEFEAVLYSLEREGKLLMVITYEKEAAEQLELVFKFTYIQEEMPRAYDIVFSFEEWKES